MALSFSITSHATLPTQPTIHPLIPRATSDPPLVGNDGWKDMKICARNCIDDQSYDSELYRYAGCSTYNCLCRADTFSSALAAMSACISSQCEDNPLDQASATSYVASYCSTGVDAATTGDKRATGSTTVTISRTVITTDGVAVTSAVPPVVTVVSMGSPQFQNIINNGNGNGNSGNGYGNSNNGRSLMTPPLYVSSSVRLP
jgi:hypothetical protein